MANNTQFQGAVEVVNSSDTATNGFGDLTAERQVQALRVRLYRAPWYVDLGTDSGLGATYNYDFPAAAPTGDGQTIVTFGTTNTFYEISAQNVRNVRKNAGPGEYLSIDDALTSILDASDTNPYTVYIYNGIYEEPALTIPPYVYLVGQSMQSVIVKPNAPGFSLISFSNNSGIAFMSITDVDPMFPALYFYNVGDYCLIHKIEITGCEKGIYCETDALATDMSLIYLEYVGTTACVTYSLSIGDTNILGGYGTQVSIENFFTYEYNAQAIIVDGLNTELLSQATVLQSDPGVGTGLTILNGARCDLRGLYFEHWNVAVSVPAGPDVPKLIMAGTLFENCTTNFDIQNDFTVGQTFGYTEYTKTQIPKIAPFFVANTDQHIITVAYKGADFMTVGAALAAITDNSPTDRYTIYVGPGVYLENQLVLKPYVTILGFFQTQCILVAMNSAVPFIVGAGYAAIDKLTLTVPAYVASPPYLIEYLGDPTGVHFRCDNIIFDTAGGLIHVGSTAGPTIFMLLNPLINMAAPFTTGLTIEDSGPNNYPISFIVDNLIWNADAVGFSNFTNLFVITSYVSPSVIPNIYGAITNSTMGQVSVAPMGDMLIISGPTYISLETCLVAGFANGVIVQPSTEPSKLLCSSSTFTDNTWDIRILSPAATGVISVNAALSKIFITPGAIISVVASDPTTGSLILTGNIYQGPSWDRVTNISEQIQHASTTGIIDDQPTFTLTGGLGVDVSGGDGYVFIGPLSTNYLKYVVWSAASLLLIDNALNYIYVDSMGNLSTSTAAPDYIANIVLGNIKTYNGDITYIQETGRVLNNLSSNLDNTFRTVLGPLVQSGCIAAPGSNPAERAVMVSSGSYALSVDVYPPLGGDNVSIIGYYGGSIETAPFTNIPLSWDNAGTLTPLLAGQWIKHSLYILSALDGTTQYFMVYAQQVFATELDAQTGPIPTQPSTFVDNMLAVAGIIVTFGDPDAPLSASRFRDIRPTLSFRSDGTTASADHNSLLNLTVGNAHPQYFRVDGTSTMAGTVQLGANNIVGSGGNLLNGVDLLAHASRHLPGGPDALATAAPVTIATINNIGSATAFSRSDHVHAHGAQTDTTLHAVATGVGAGFMSSADKTKLDAATPLSVVSTLVSRSAAGMSQFSELQLKSSTTTNAISFVANPTAFVVDRTISVPVPASSDTLTLLAESQSLTNKTIIGSTNTVAASQLRTTGADVVISTAAPPVTNRVLLSDSAISAIWSTVPNAALTNSSITVTGTGGLTGGGTIALGGSTTISLSVPVTAPNGGTGQTVYAQGDILYASTTTALTRLAAAATGNVLRSGTAPSWGKVVLTGDVSGILPIGNGGTGSSTALTGNLIMVSNAGGTSIVESTSSLVATSNQLVLGAGQTTTISAPTPAVSAIYTMSDVGTSANFIMSAGAQTIGGTKSFSAKPIILANSGLQLNNSGNTFNTTIFSASSLTANTVIRFPSGDGSSGYILSTDGSGNTSWVASTGGTVTSVATGTGLTGGPITTSGTISLADTAVTPGTYGSATQVPSITVDQQGRLTEVTPITITGTVPGGTASGDLTGTYPGPTVAAIRGTAVSITAPTANQTLILSGGVWTPSLVGNSSLTNSSLTVSAGTGLTGGGSVSLGGATTLSLATSGVTASTYGSATVVPQIIVDIYGRITSATDTTIVLPLTGGTNVSGTLPIGNGGTGSSTALTGSRIMVSTASQIVESTSSLSATSNQLVLGTGQTTTINAPTPAASAIYTIPDVGTSANFIMSAGSQTVGGTKSFSAKPIILANSGLQLNNAANTFSTTLLAGTGLGVDTTIRFPTSSGTSGQVLRTDGSGNTSWVSTTTGTVTSVATGTGLTGGPITTSGTISLDDTAVTPGTYGSATVVPQFDVDQQGRLTSVTPVTIAGVTPGGSASGDLSGTYPGPTVVALQGTSISATSPSANQTLILSGGVWTPSFIPNASLTNSSITVTAGTGLSGGGSVSLGGSTTISLSVPVVATSGGTGQTVYAVGDILYASTTTALTRLAAAASGNVLRSGTSPNWGKVALGGDVSGTLPVANGGTGSSTALVGDFIMVSNTGGTSIVESTSSLVATSNQLVLGTGQTTTINAPTPAASSIYTIPDVGTLADFVMTVGAQTVGDVKSFSAKPIILSNSGLQLNNAADTFSTILLAGTGLATDTTIRFPTSSGTSGQFLSTDGSGNTSWASTTTGTVTSVATGTGLTGGPITTSGTISLANTAVTIGTYGSATVVPQIIVDQQGRLTSVTPITITGVTPGGSASGDLTGTYPGPTVAALRGTSVSATTPTANQTLILSGGVWTPSLIGNASLTNSSLTVTAGTGLTGGGSVSLGGSTTLNIGTTGVSAGSYTHANITVNAQGQLSVASSGTSSIPVSFSVVTNDYTVTATDTTIGNLSYQNSRYSGYSTRTVRAWVVPSSSATRTITLSVLPNGGTALGSLSIPGGSAVGAIYTFTITAPAGDTVLNFRAVRTGAGGTNGTVSSITIEFS